MQVSASVYSCQSRDIVDLAEDLDKVHVDYLHVDCNDDPGVFDDLERLTGASRIPIDLHMITPEPAAYFERIADLGIELVSFQYEPIRDKSQLKDARGLDCRLGLGLRTDTDLKVFDDYATDYSIMLFMATTPGKSGGVFQPDNFNKIEEFRRRYPGKRTHVDGGVTGEIASRLRRLGVDLAVSGSYLVRSDSMARSLLLMTSNIRDLALPVERFMLRLNELPLLYEEANIANLLGTMDRHRLGFVMVVGSSGQLDAVVSDGDLRRSILSNLQLPPAELPLERLLNRKPVTIHQKTSVKEMLRITEEHARPIMFLPVVDDEERLVGAISLNHLRRRSA